MKLSITKQDLIKEFDKEEVDECLNDLDTKEYLKKYVPTAERTLIFKVLGKKTAATQLEKTCLVHVAVSLWIKQNDACKEIHLSPKTYRTYRDGNDDLVDNFLADFHKDIDERVVNAYVHESLTFVHEAANEVMSAYGLNPVKFLERMQEKNIPMMMEGIEDCYKSLSKGEIAELKA